MREKTVKREVINMILICLMFFTGIFFIADKISSNNYEIQAYESIKGNCIVELNEVKQLCSLKKYEEASKKADELINQIRAENIGDKNYESRKILIMFLLCVLAIILVFFYIYIKILKPFDELKSFAGQIALGNLDVELKYKRVNVFGDFTWAFDHMRTELINARMNEQSAIENNKTVIASLSHDIKTPIASIRGYAEALIMNMDTDKERRRRYADVIIKKCDEVAKITNDMFIHSLHNLDHLVIKKEKVKLGEVIKETLNDMNVSNDIVIRGEILNADIDNADKNRICQVIGNIITNARKYAPDGGIEIRTKLEDGIYILSIRDFGKGIDDEDMPFIFDKFYRGKNVRNESGAGLGLFIVRYIMEQMGGRVELKNSNDGLEVNLIFYIS